MSTTTLTLSPLSGFQRHLRLTLCSIGEPTFLFGAYLHVKSEQSGTQPSMNVWFVSCVSRDTFQNATTTYVASIKLADPTPCGVS